MWAKTLTGSSAAAGMVIFCIAAPRLLAPLSGLLVDRVRRRPLLIVTNLATAVAVLPLLFVHDRGDVWIIYAVTLAYGFSYTRARRRASRRCWRRCCPADELADANALMQTAREGLRLVAPLAGAALYAAAGGAAVALLDALTFVVAAGAARARCGCVEPEAGAAHRRASLAEIAAGARHLRITVPLRQLTVASGAALLVIGFSETLTFEVAGTGLGRDPSFVGVLLAVQGVGAVAGALTGGAARSGASARASSPALGMLVFAVGVTLLTGGTLPVVLAGIVLFGLGIPWIVVALFTLLQRLTPGPLQGRTYSAVEVLRRHAADDLDRARRGARRARGLPAPAARWRPPWWPAPGRGCSRAPSSASPPRTNLGPRMDLSLFFAGTAGSVPTARRGLPALLLRAGGERILFDCGEGTQQQLLRSVGLPELDAVFITHFHLDHWLGLLGMLKTFDLRARERPLTIYGPPGLQPLLAGMRPVIGRTGYPLAARRARAPRRDPLRLVPDHAVPGQPPRRGVRLRVRRGRPAGALRRRGGARALGVPTGRTSAACSAARPSTACARSR